MSSASGTCGGGWRYKIGSDYVTFPVTLDVLRAPPVLGSCSASLTQPTMSVSNTNDAQIFCESEITSTISSLGDLYCDQCNNGPAVDPFGYHVSQERSYSKIKRATITLLPDLDQSFKRMVDEGYGALIRRGGTPKVQATATQICCKQYFSSCTEPPSACTGSLPSTSIKVTHSRENGKDRWIDDDASDAEDYLTTLTYAPYSYYGKVDDLYDLQFSFFDPGICPGGEEGGGTVDLCACFDDQRYRIFREMICSYPNVDTTSSGSGNPDLLLYLYHANSTARYINYIAHRHWSFCYLVPKDSNANFWKLHSTKVNVSDYWGKAREQYADLDTANLRSIDKKQIRNSCQSPPWLEGVHKTLVKDNFDVAESSWWGVSRFKAQNVSVPASMTLDSGSSSRWTFTNCSAAFGATIVLTPSGASISGKFALGSFSVTPFLYPLLAKRIGLNWSGTNITSITWKLVNQQGDEITLATTTGTHDKPTGSDSHFAGSWAQDYGCGVITDLGVDTASGGVSGSTLLSAELIACFELIAGWTATYLKFEITVTNPANPVTLNYPTFYAPTDAATVLVENGAVSAILYADGPGLRYGQWDCWDTMGDALASSPVVRAPGQKATALDWLIWSRLMLQGIAQTTNLDSEINSLWDTEELGGGSVRKSAKTYTISFVADGSTAIGGVGCLVNSYAEVPPLACFPRKARDADYQETGGYAMEAWCLDVAPRYHINPQREMHLEDPSGNRWTSAIANVPSGWKNTQHSHVVTNNENADHSIVSDPDGEFATTSPWRGWFAMLSPGTDASGTNPWNLHTQAGLFLRAGIKSSKIHFWKAGVSRPPFSTDVDVTSRANCANPRMIEDKRGRLYIVFECFSGGAYASYEATSDDDGESWNTESAMAITNGRRPTIAVNSNGTIVRAAFVYNSGSSGPGKIKATIQYPGDTAQSSVFTLVDDAGSDMVFADDSFHITADRTNEMRWLLSCRINGETDTSEWWSTDECASFKRIT